MAKPSDARVDGKENVVLIFPKPAETSELQTSVETLEAWFGPNIYTAFVRKRNRAPAPDEAATIGLLIGGRVKAADGSMQPPLRPSDREIRRNLKSRRTAARRRYDHIVRLRAAISALSENEDDPAEVIQNGSCLLDSTEIAAQLDIALCWLNRFAEEWHDRQEKARTAGS